MRPTTLYAAMAGGLVLATAAASAAGQQLVCDRAPTSNTSASCFLQGTPAHISAPLPQPAGTTYYFVEPAPAVQVPQAVIAAPVVAAPVVAAPVVATPLRPVTMSYFVDEPYPDPSPARREVRTQVYVPAVQTAIESGPSMPRGDRNITPD